MTVDLIMTMMSEDYVMRRKQKGLGRFLGQFSRLTSVRWVT
jgi:hypothetical protein